VRLYLVQHGDAVAKEVDPDRPLSEQGMKDAVRTASFLKRAGVRVSRVIHSGKKRAEDTAELLATATAPGKKPESVPGLDPFYPPEGLAQKIAHWKEDTMVVGHLPYLEKLVSRLLTGRQAPGVVAFTPGSVLCLERDEDGSWKLLWMIRPDLLGGS